MKKTLILTTALVSFGFAANADVTVMSWGGAYGAAQNEAHVKPWAAATGNATIMVDSDNPAPAIKAMVEAGNVTVDVASVEYADAIRLCDEGILEPIDAASLPAAPDGTPATEDFLAGAITECGVSTDIWSNVFAYDTTKFTGEVPTTAADFFNLEKFPGKRGLKKGAKAVLEFALLGDGVPAAEVYALLDTPEGVDRAFAKLDTIKAETVWCKPFQIVWDGQVYENEMYVVPKGAPNKDLAMEFIRYATSTEGLRAQAQHISYGPARKSSFAEPIVFKDGKTVMAPHLPTAPENLGNALETSAEFWVDHDAELNERFQAWLSQ